MTALAEPSRERTPLAAELADRRMSARELARQAGVHENSVYAWVAGKAAPTPDNAVRTAAALDLPAERVFPGVVPPDHRPLPAADQALPGARPSRSTADRNATDAATSPAGATPAGARVSQWLPEALRRHGLTSAQLAERVGIDRSAIRHWLTGRSEPRADTAVRLAEALDVPLDTIRDRSAAATPLAAALTERGWSAARLAGTAGVSGKAVADWAAGRTNPRPDTAARVAGALGIPADRLLPAAEPAPPDTRVPTVDQVLARPATADPGWGADAACAAPDQDPDQWWPAAGDPAVDARATCGACPVQGDCRDAYLNSPDRPEDRAAIWAGLPGWQLRAAAARQQIPTTQPDRTSRGRRDEPGRPARDVQRPDRREPLRPPVGRTTPVPAM